MTLYSVFVSSPINHHSRNSFLKFDVKSTGYVRTTFFFTVLMLFWYLLPVGQNLLLESSLSSALVLPHRIDNLYVRPGYIVEYSAYIKTTTTTTRSPRRTTTQMIVLRPPFVDAVPTSKVFPPKSSRGHNSRPSDSYRPITYPELWGPQQSGQGELAWWKLVTRERERERERERQTDRQTDRQSQRQR